MDYIKRIVLLVTIISLFGCNLEDDTSSELDQLTVEASIQEGDFARVFLTNSIAFNGVIDSLTIAKSTEGKAKVVLKTANESEILTLKRDNSRFPFFFYRSNTIKGKLGERYTLEISVRGKDFFSETIIPVKPIIEKIEFIDATEEGKITEGFKDIKLTIKKDVLKTAYYKLLIKNTDDVKFVRARPFIVNTENINSSEFSVIVRFTKDDENDDPQNQLVIGNTVNLKFIAISEQQFDFWKSIEGDATTLLEGSSFSEQIKSNIQGGAFGYWSGENEQEISITIKE